MSFVPQISYYYKAVAEALDKSNDRFALYFHNCKGIYNNYKELIEQCESLGSEDIALCAGGDSIVYPFLIYFKDNRGLCIREIPLWDGTPLDDGASAPEYIACIDVGREEVFSFKGFDYKMIFSNGYHIYKRESPS